MFEGVIWMDIFGSSEDRACEIKRFAFSQKSDAMWQSINRCHMVSLWILQLLQRPVGKANCGCPLSIALWSLIVWVSNSLAWVQSVLRMAALETNLSRGMF